MSKDIIKAAVFFLGFVGSFVFFFWGIVWEMAVWQKSSPDLLNSVLFLVCCLVCSLVLFSKNGKSVKAKGVPKKVMKQYQKDREELEKELFAAKTRKEKLRILEELKHTK